MIPCLAQKSGLLAGKWQVANGNSFVSEVMRKDTPLDTQEVTDSSSVEPTTKSFVSTAGPAGCPAADLLIHRKPVRYGRHLVGSRFLPGATPRSRRFKLKQFCFVFRLALGRVETRQGATSVPRRIA